MRSTITATKRYEIGNLEVDPVRPQSEDRLDDSIRKFLELGKNK
jgi:hypothetical protein